MGKKEKRREKGGKREKSIGGRIMTKSDIQGGNKYIISPNLYRTYLGGKYNFVRQDFYQQEERTNVPTQTESQTDRLKGKPQKGGGGNARP